MKACCRAARTIFSRATIATGRRAMVGGLVRWHIVALICRMFVTPFNETRGA